MSETTEFKDVYEAIASVSPNRQNILYTVLEEDAFGEKAFFSDDKLVWESTKGGFFSQNQEEVGNSMTADRPQPPERNCSATA